MTSLAPVMAKICFMVRGFAFVPSSLGSSLRFFHIGRLRNSAAVRTTWIREMML